MAADSYASALTVTALPLTRALQTHDWTISYRPLVEQTFRARLYAQREPSADSMRLKAFGLVTGDDLEVLVV
jgi:hypothetical protein